MKVELHGGKPDLLRGYNRCIAVALSLLAIMGLACAAEGSLAPQPTNEPLYIPAHVLVDAAVHLRMDTIPGTVECSGTVTGQIGNVVEVLTIEHCEDDIMVSSWVSPDGNRSKGVELRHGGNNEVLKTEPLFCDVIGRDLNEDNPALCYLDVIGNLPSWFAVLPENYLGSDTPIQVGERVINLSYPRGYFAPDLEVEASVVQWIGNTELPEDNIYQEEICTEQPAFEGESGSMLYRLSTGEIVAIVNSPCESPNDGIYNFKGSRRLPPKSELRTWVDTNRERYRQEFAPSQ